MLLHVSLLRLHMWQCTSSVFKGKKSASKQNRRAHEKTTTLFCFEFTRIPCHTPSDLHNNDVVMWMYWFSTRHIYVRRIVSSKFTARTWAERERKWHTVRVHTAPVDHMCLHSVSFLCESQLIPFHFVDFSFIFLLIFFFCAVVAHFHCVSLLCKILWVVFFLICP